MGRHTWNCKYYFLAKSTRGWRSRDEKIYFKIKLNILQLVTEQQINQKCYENMVVNRYEASSLGGKIEFHEKLKFEQTMSHFPAFNQNLKSTEKLNAQLTLGMGQPIRLIMMLGSYGDSIQTNNQDHCPIEKIWLNNFTAFSAKKTVPSSPVPTRRDLKWG